MHLSYLVLTSVVSSSDSGNLCWQRTPFKPPVAPNVASRSLRNKKTLVWSIAMLQMWIRIVPCAWMENPFDIFVWIVVWHFTTKTDHENSSHPRQKSFPRSTWKKQLLGSCKLQKVSINVKVKNNSTMYETSIKGCGETVIGWHVECELTGIL